jgi:hypothetical protein
VVTPLDPLHLQDRVHVGGVEGALAGLVHDRLTLDRVDLLDDVVAVGAADEEPAHRPFVADMDLRVATLVLGARQVREVGAVPFAGVDHEDPRLAAGLQDALGSRQGGEQEGCVVAERLAEAAGIHEVALEVDHHQRGLLGIELEVVGFRLHAQHALTWTSFNCPMD